MAHNFADTAKILGTGRNKLCKQLREKGVLMKNNLPKQKYICKGIFTVSHRTFDHSVIGLKHYGKTLVTEKGIDWIANELNLTAPTCEQHNQPDHPSAA